MRAKFWGGTQRGHGCGITRTLRTQGAVLRAQSILPEHLPHVGIRWDPRVLPAGYISSTLQARQPLASHQVCED